jgi:hypothetical protein
MNSQFLNVDLEIKSEQDLQLIVADFGDQVFNLYCGQIDDYYLATFEIQHDQIEHDADAIIAYFCVLINGLSQPAREVWYSAHTRVFDLGYECGLAPTNHVSAIRSETIE